MSYATIFGFIVCSVCLAIGQLLFKRAAISATEGGLYQIVLSPYLWVALFVYGFTTLLWVYLLRTVDLSKAYPFMALTFIMVPLAATVFLGEVQSLQYWIGLTLVLIGIFLTVI